MSKPRRLDLPRTHPSIDKNFERRLVYGHLSMAAKVTCPRCRAVRWFSLSVLRQQLQRDNFNGQCKPCGQLASRDGTFQTKARKNGGRRQLHKSGYVVRGPTSVPSSDLPLFRQMQNRAGTVLEHRLVMAKYLERPLFPNEMVDHRNGIKNDNAIGNLRVYLRGKNQEGSANGYGTYYHEWQMAEVEIRRLKLQLADERDIGG